MSWLDAILDRYQKATNAVHRPPTGDAAGTAASALGKAADTVNARPGTTGSDSGPSSAASLIDEAYLAEHAEAMQYVKFASGALAFHSNFTALPHGDRAFEELYRALQAAEHEIFLATWFLEPDMELLRANWDQPVSARSPYVLENVLLDRAKAGVTIRVLVWNFLNLGEAPAAGSGGGGSPIMNRVKELGAALAKISAKNEVVIVEHPMPFATRTVLGVSFPLGGSHHQKFWITRSGRNLTAFVGGINLRQHDWDTVDHQVLDQRRNPPDMEGAERKRKETAQEDPGYPPRYDWMARVDGPAAYRVLEEFNRRWGMAGKGKLSVLAFNQVLPAGKLFVQASHTYPIDFGGGDFEILKVYEHAISRARRYLYFENQYWTSERLTDALVARLKEAEDLEVVIVLPDKAEDPVVGAYIAGEQWYQLSRLWAAASRSRVRAYVLYKKHPVHKRYVNVYVHAKVAIVDDLWATVGSANTNNRSMIIDTEYNTQIAHGPTVTAIRKQVWQKLLGGGRGEADDPIAAIREGFHPVGEANEKRMADGLELEGSIVPLKAPAEIKRLPEVLRPLL